MLRIELNRPFYLKDHFEGTPEIMGYASTIGLKQEELLEPDQKAFQVRGFLSESRADEWLKGRAALYGLAQWVNRAPPQGERCFPHPQFSLTHSNGIAIAVTSGPDAPLRGLGVDLEFKMPKEKSTKFFLNDTDHQIPGLSELLQSDPGMIRKIWTLKEATYKADLDNAGKVMRSYDLDTTFTKRKGTLHRNQFEFISDEMNLGELTGHFTVVWKSGE